MNWPYSVLTVGGFAELQLGGRVVAPYGTSLKPLEYSVCVEVEWFCGRRLFIAVFGVSPATGGLFLALFLFIGVLKLTEWRFLMVFPFKRELK